MAFPVTRLRRLRRTAELRNLVSETRLTPDAFVYPMFVCPGEGVRKAVGSMPGVFNLSVDEAVKEAREAHLLGVPAVILFGLPDKKDEVATGAWVDDGIVQQAARAMKREVPGLILMGDVCLCEYMSHGHCGIVKTTFTPQSLGAAVRDAITPSQRVLAVKNGVKNKAEKDKAIETMVSAAAHAVQSSFEIDNDASLELLARTSVSLAKAGIDITLPGAVRTPGIEHPLLKTMEEIVRVFHHLGYSTALGPQVESDFYNFEALNFPPNHPARDTQDTLVVAGQQTRPSRERLLMRTHTSPVQIRTMIAQAPPVRIVVPGKVHRNDAADATHSPVFHQVEGLCVDTNITFSDLKGTLDHAMKAFFGSAVKTRFFPSFFPFTEPSADVQISCIFCGG